MLCGRALPYCADGHTVVAHENTTCLVFSQGEPTKFAGRGDDGQFSVVENSGGTRISNAATTRIDVSAFVQLKGRRCPSTVRSILLGPICSRSPWSKNC